MKLSVESILEAYKNLKTVQEENTPLQKLHSNGLELYAKREDMQITGSYKFRGAYNFMSRTNAKEVVCASTGNHAKAVAYCCNLLKIRGTVFMPECTPDHKIENTKEYGKEWVTIELVGKTFDDSLEAALKSDKTFIHPFDDELVVSGQGTIGVEILQQIKPAYIFIPVGGGGMITGIATYVKAVSPNTKIVAVEPVNSACLYEAVCRGERVVLKKMNKFVDAVAVKQAGKIAFSKALAIPTTIDIYVQVPNANVKRAMKELHHEGIEAEPAGALAYAAIYDRLFCNKKGIGVCVISGGMWKLGKNFYR